MTEKEMELWINRLIVFSAVQGIAIAILAYHIFN